jgi:hypothetical protein
MVSRKVSDALDYALELTLSFRAKASSGGATDDDRHAAFQLPRPQVHPHQSRRYARDKIE